jgi:hypothetical protein
MKKVFTIVMFLVLVLSLAPAVALADEPATQSGEGIGVSAATAMPLDGSWVVLDEYMDPGDYFSGPWEWDMPYLVRFTITDLFVVSDQFEVYDDGTLVATTPAMPDWDDLGIADPYDSPPWTDDADVALADGRFSSAVLYFGPGAHSIEIRDIHIPPLTAGGGPFPDGTVAFKAEPLVEFTKEITEMNEAGTSWTAGGDGDGILETGEDWYFEMTITLTNISGETITGINMHDRLGGDLEWHWLNSVNMDGGADIYYKGKTDKVFMDWYNDFDLADGESCFATMAVSPDVNTGTGNGKKAGHQEFTSAGEHCLNSGASFKGWIGDESIGASTEPVCVMVYEAD